MRPFDQDERKSRVGGSRKRGTARGSRSAQTERSGAPVVEEGTNEAHAVEGEELVAGLRGEIRGDSRPRMFSRCS